MYNYRTRMNKTCSVTIYIEKEKIQNQIPPLLPLASWLRLGIAKGPRRPVRPWVQVAPRHLLHSNLSDANTRFDENILSRIFRVVGRRASIHPCKKTLSLFYLLADGATFLPTEIVSLLSIRKMEECIFHSNYRDSRKKFLERERILVLRKFIIS